MVLLPFWTRGSRKIWRPFETASMPVYVPPPMEKARRKSKAIPPRPSVARPPWNPDRTVVATAPISGMCLRTP